MRRVDHLEAEEDHREDEGDARDGELQHRRVHRRARQVAAHAARRATQFVPRVAPEPESEDESHPATPVDDGAKSEEEIWPEKDEDTDMSRSRRMMEDAFRSLPGMRGKAADKYITTRAA